MLVVITAAQAKDLQFEKFQLYVTAAFYLGQSLLEIQFATRNTLSQADKRGATIDLAYDLGFNPDIDKVVVR